MSRKTGIVCAATVPLPRGAQDNLLALDDEMPLQVAQGTIAATLLRYYPDKFSQRCHDQHLKAQLRKQACASTSHVSLVACTPEVLHCKQRN